jgi:hypothetical protein
MSEHLVPCDQNGCVCKWANTLDDNALCLAVSCLHKELFRRSGIDRATVKALSDGSMDPGIVQLQAALLSRFKDGAQ